MTRPSVTNGLLTAALIACGLLVAALVYGFATRTLTPRTTPLQANAGANPDSAAAEHAAALLRSRITVEVRNGTRIDGLAARTRELLQRRGFDVLEVGTTAVADSTTVTARNGTRADAAHVAGALGLPERRIVPGGQADENATTVSVTLGPDYTDFTPLRTLQ